MKGILPVALVMGVIAGLLVGGVLNVINVPVMEWAITLEEAAAEAEAASLGEAPEEEGGIAITLGQQRVGLVLGFGLFGVLFSAIFTGFYHLVRRATPGWNVWAWAMIAGVLGFWAVSLFTQIKFPSNPPGIGEEGTLLSRQWFQLLFTAISIVAVAVSLVAIKAINESGTHGLQRWLRYAGLGIAFAVVALIQAFVIPGNPDPTPEWVPEALIIMFRTFTLFGHFLFWVLLPLGVAGYLKYNERGIKAVKPPADHAFAR